MALDDKANILYFGFGTNKDMAMMQHMIGREDIAGVPGRLLGYEVCIQKARQMRTLVPPTSPVSKTPRQLIIDNWYDDFPMFVSRPNPSVLHMERFGRLPQKKCSLCATGKLLTLVYKMTPMAGLLMKIMNYIKLSPRALFGPNRSTSIMWSKDQTMSHT